MAGLGSRKFNYNYSKGFGGRPLETVASWLVIGLGVAYRAC